MNSWDYAETLSVETEKVIDEDPRVWMNAALEACKRNDFVEALDDINNVKMFDAETKVCLGNAYALEVACNYNLGNVDEAREVFSRYQNDGLERFLMENPNYVVAYCKFDLSYWKEYWGELVRWWIEQGNYERIKEFADNIDDDEFVSWADINLIGWIVEVGGWKFFQKLINGNFDFTKVSDGNINLLMVVAHTNTNDTYRMMEYLLENNIYPINKCNEHGLTALMMTLCTNQQKKANLILTYNPDINMREENGLTALHMAADADMPLVIEKIVSLGGRIDEKDNEFYTPLHHSVLNKSFLSLKKLLALGADVNVRSDMGVTALHMAVESRQCILELLNYNADINAKDDIGATPILYAVVKNSVEGVESLANKGANLDLKYNISSWNRTLLQHIAATVHWKSPRREMWKILLKNNANVNIVDDNGYTALMLSVDHKWSFSDELEMARALVGKGADKNIRANDGNTVYSIMRRHNIDPAKLDNNSSSNWFTKMFD